ncbi:uncharacterized protein LOC124934936 [Impatiens glandulifera]|uniref:uncharacterized protein LOC124934936 n=1 Tax=Impatiens glandulifera TaxID=253017 RepID=UPI001FB1429C|nr:uncharacterized protein LOC124934936 [Impatiens glandulifera]
MEISHSSSTNPIIFFSILILLFINCSARHHQTSDHEHSGELKTTSNFQLPNINPGITKICHDTDYFDVCVSSIAPLLKGREGTSDIPSVLQIAIQAATDKTKDALAELERIASDSGSSKQLKSTLNDCRDSYNDALENFQSALDALPSRDVGTMNSMLSACVTDFGDCDDFLDGFEVSLPDINRKLTQMTSNCLAISSLLN